MKLLKKIIHICSRITFEDIKSCLMFTFALLPSIVVRQVKRDIWIIAERPSVAGDNGLELYKWIRINHPEDNVYFMLSRNAWNYNAEDTHMIAWGSFKHHVYYLASDIHINVMFHSDEINARLCRFLLRTIKHNTKIAYIRHGIHKDSIEMHKYSVLGVRLFICGAKPEYDFFRDNAGYPDENLKYTGFARFDDLLMNRRDDHFILIIPTWRRYVVDYNLSSEANLKNFLSSDFYKKYLALINDERFDNFLEAIGYKAKFCVHAEFREYAPQFELNSKNISIVGENESIHELLLSNSMVITDYSSVFFDAAYAEKPMIFYQFDYEEFRKKHFAEGYFSYERDAMGPVVHTQDELIDRIVEAWTGRSFDFGKEYQERSKRFFPLHDTNNCQRIYDAIKNI